MAPATWKLAKLMDGTGGIVGQGRSGKVFRVCDGQGRDAARKVFHCDWLTKLIHYIVFGAPNPYIWCEDAVRAAVLRRQILTDLVEFWLGRSLRVANALAWRWNAGHRALELHTEWINGRHAALHQPFADPRHNEARDLHHHVLKPLQRHLTEAGFDGLLWQAGLGNPVALNNFLLERDGAGGGWVWIDLESGVPALFALNPLQLLRFYLPKTWRHGGPLFDDVDIHKLRRYLSGRRSELRDRLGGDRVLALDRRSAELASRQNTWRLMRRVDRSIQHQQARGGIDASRAQWYSNHPSVWYRREVRRGFLRATRKSLRFAAEALGRLYRFNYLDTVKNIASFLFSQRYRAALARTYVTDRIEHWRRREQLRADEADLLRDHLDREQASSYLTDFGVHLAIKPLVKAVEWGLVPLLVTAGLLSGEWIAIALAGGGAFARTLYTGGRLIQSALRGHEKPWLALGAGLLPVIGNLAYPLQIVYTSTGADHQLARFIIYDAFSQFGQKLPIWGGCDTLTEHVFNRTPHRFIRDRTHASVSGEPTTQRRRPETRPAVTAATAGQRS